MAEQFVEKFKSAENLSRVVTNLLQRKSWGLQRPNDLRKSHASVQMAVA